MCCRLSIPNWQKWRVDSVTAATAGTKEDGVTEGVSRDGKTVVQGHTSALAVGEVETNQMAITMEDVSKIFNIMTMYDFFNILI